MKWSIQEIGMIVFLGMLTAIAPLSMDMYLPALPEVAQEFSVSPSMAQLTMTMTLLGMALGQLLGGPLADCYGRKRPLLLGMFVFMASSFLCSRVGNIDVFLLLRFLQGFFGSFGLVIGRAIARDEKTGSDLLVYLSVLMMINGLAPILAPIIGGQILRFTDWHGIFDAIAIVGVVLTLSSAHYTETLPKEKRIPGISNAFLSFPALFKDSFFMGNCLIQGFLFISFFGYMAGSSFVFQNMYGMSPQSYSLVLGTIGVGLLATGLMPVKLAKHVLDDTMLRISILISLIGSIFLFIGFYNKLSLWYVLPVLFITIIPLSIIETVSLSMAVSRQGKRAGAASALIGFFSVAPGGLAMALVGIAGENTAVPLGLVILFGYVFCFASYWKWVHGK